jgi:hypothetical protein
MLLFGQLFGFVTCLLHFSIFTPIKALPAIGAVGQKLSFQQDLAPGTAIVAIVLGPPGEDDHFFHLHRHTVRQHQLKIHRKISQIAGPLPLSDCHNMRSFSCMMYISAYPRRILWGLDLASILSPPFMRRHKRRTNEILGTMVLWEIIQETVSTPENAVC